MLYRRFAQARAMNTLSFWDAYTLESAAAAAKPAEIDSGLTEFHAGLRVASTKTKGASINGAGTSMVGLSAAVSGAFIPVRTSLGSADGGAVAIDVLVPIIPSKDGQDRSNNLVWAGEALSGSGVGGLEYSGLASGVPAAQAAAGNGLPGAGTAVDSGIAGINNGGTLSLIRYRVFRTHLQYSLPGGKWAVSTGYSQVEGRNIGDFGAYAAQVTSSGSPAPALLAPKIQYGYASLFYDPLSWLRFAGEISRTRDTYANGSDRFAYNDRVQISAFFIF
jgi:hypothetical protein